MIIVLYALILLGFWIRALRIQPEKYPNVDAEKLMLWKQCLMKAYKLYAIFFFILIALSLGVSFLQNKITRLDPTVNFSTSPLYFKLCVGIVALYAIFTLVYISIKAVRHHKIGKEIGVYAS